MSQFFESPQDMHKFHITEPDAEIIVKESGYYLVELLEPNSSVNIHGVFSANGDERVDVEIILHHKAPHTQADTTLKGVGRDSSFVRFVGRIIIDENCGNTQSFLTERILLLSDKAKAETIPDLEISSDDVKCSHAASISRIPEEQIFYLMSRGIARRDAEEMIVAGFLE